MSYVTKLFIALAVLVLMMVIGGLLSPEVLVQLGVRTVLMIGGVAVVLALRPKRG